MKMKKEGKREMIEKKNRGQKTMDMMISKRKKNNHCEILKGRKCSERQKKYNLENKR